MPPQLPRWIHEMNPTSAFARQNQFCRMNPTCTDFSVFPLFGCEFLQQLSKFDLELVLATTF